MKIDLLPGEEVLRTIEGRRFQLNPILRLIATLRRIIGFSSRVVVTLTSERCIVEEQAIVLWSIPTTRLVTIVSMEDISSILGVKTSFFLLIKTYNLIVVSGGVPLVGVNLKRMTNTVMDAEINGLSMLKQGCKRRSA